MPRHYVLDANALIAYFGDVIRSSPKCRDTHDISLDAKRTIEQALVSETTDVRLTVPSVAFVEVYKNCLTNEELVRGFYYEVFVRLAQSPNVEIRALDREVLENLVAIGDNLLRHELHDKLIVATARVLKATLITTDSAIQRYARNPQSGLRALP